MRLRQSSPLASAALLTAALFITLPNSASADLPDLELGVLGGTGIGSSSDDGSPYRIILGAEAAVIVSNYVVGARYLRTWAEVPEACVDCERIGDLTSLGLDLGYEWELAMLHLGPRLGVGWMWDSGADDAVKDIYLDPGAALDVQIALFVVGVDVRYRVVPSQSSANSGIALAKLGLRF